VKKYTIHSASIAVEANDEQHARELWLAIVNTVAVEDPRFLRISDFDPKILERARILAAGAVLRDEKKTIN
jgi:hypothetical protein